MIDESAEMQLRRLLTKALDEAFAQGLESGKRTGFESGRRVGIEEAISTIQRATVYDLGDIVQMSRKLRALLEAK